MVSNASSAREAAADLRDDAKRASENIQADIDALRTDVTNLAKRLSDLVASKGNSALKQAKSGIDDTIARARDTGDELTDALNDAIQTRPFTTLAVVAGIGFVLGTVWRR
jgi:ElaB/YqjD/DUF883 family membrane-anchored ribosome-binding protein